MGDLLEIATPSQETKVNHKYLMFWTGMGCVLLQVQGGFVIGENTRVGIILA
jgi:hypothetical protein